LTATWDCAKSEVYLKFFAQKGERLCSAWGIKMCFEFQKRGM
jgi:hypothetical protein